MKGGSGRGGRTSWETQRKGSYPLKALGYYTTGSRKAKPPKNINPLEDVLEAHHETS